MLVWPGAEHSAIVGQHHLDVAFAALGRKAFEEEYLCFGAFDLAFSDGFFEPQHAFLLGQQALAPPDAAHAAGGDVDAFKAKLLLHVDSSMAGVGEGMVEDGLLDLGGDAIEMRIICSRQAVDEGLGPADLEIAPDLSELLTGAAHHLAAADVGKFCGKIEQG